MDIFEATRSNQIDELVSALKETHPDVIDSRGSTPLIIAGYYNHKEAISVLLLAKANPDFHDHMGNTALMGACFKGYMEIAKILLNAGAIVDKQNGNMATALSFASTFGNAEMVELLLKNGANPLLKDKFGKSPIDYAMVQENESCYELLAAAANNILFIKNNLSTTQNIYL